MFKSALLLATCLIALSNAAEVSIFSSPFHPRHVAPKALNGVVELVCGASAPVDIRLQGCGSAPCQLTRGQVYTLEIDFRSRDLHWIMRLHAILLQNTELQVLFQDNGLPDSSIRDHELKTFRFEFQVPQGFTGASLFKLKLYENYIHEICVQIPVNIQ